jgi:hypothetical protein
MMGDFSLIVITALKRRRLVGVWMWFGCSISDDRLAHGSADDGASPEVQREIISSP